ncbi:MAG: GTP pyrophosphokinase family protein [Lachnospira sp.]|nr:GTP pyrophosphokinase family protein [Lachnospira sp.]MDD5829055.1 GTP pyrophosphokinase family protein [Lachnospira sp.]
MELNMWKEILNPYDLAVEELKLKFNHIVKEYNQAGMYSPIEQVLGRVKSISSIIDKAQKRGIDIDKIEEKLEDIAGIRLICQFTDDIYTVVELIRNRKDMKVKSEKDYVKNMKESGYRSYHVIVLYSVETAKGTKEIPVEIQIRTLGMNFWAIIEHSLQYKYSGNIPAHVRERLSAASDAIITLDNEMSSIHYEIIDAQNYHLVKANIVSDILSNIQNLYKVANKQEIVKIQDEFYELYKQDDISRLERFNRQLDIIAEDYRAQSVN